MMAPPAYHRAQARLGPALLLLCRLVVRLAHRCCPPPLPTGPGGAPLTYQARELAPIWGSCIYTTFMRGMVHMSKKSKNPFFACPIKRRFFETAETLQPVEKVCCRA